MWLLKEDSGRLIYLKPNRTAIVGRNKGDIVLANDASISRIHAKLVVEKKFNANEIDDAAKPLSQLKIVDPGSKYGNFILRDNGTRELRISSEYVVKNNDRIRFGLQYYIFTASYVPLISVTTGMTADDKAALLMILEEIGGALSNVWTPWCTHMTVGSANISEKLSCSLAAGMKIVAIDYWNAALRAFRESLVFPDSDSFAKTVNDKLCYLTGASVNPNPMRRKALENLTFLHFNRRQYSLYSRMISLAGGKSIVYATQNDDIPDVCNDNVIVVQSIESNTTQATVTFDANYAKACDKLRRCRRRTIPESEIALAILYCSREKYCNPKYDFASLLQYRNANTDSSISNIIAADTQDVGASAGTVSNIKMKSAGTSNAGDIIMSSPTQEETFSNTNIVNDSTKDINESQQKSSSDENTSISPNKHFKTSNFSAESQKKIIGKSNSISSSSKESNVCVRSAEYRKKLLCQQESMKDLRNESEKSSVDSVRQQNLSGFVPETVDNSTEKSDFVNCDVESYDRASSEEFLIPDRQKNQKKNVNIESSNEKMSKITENTYGYSVKRSRENDDEISLKTTKKSCDNWIQTGAGAKCASDVIKTFSIKEETFEEFGEYAKLSASPSTSKRLYKTDDSDKNRRDFIRESSDCIDGAELSRKRKTLRSESTESSESRDTDETPRKREKKNDSNKKVSAKGVKYQRTLTEMISSQGLKSERSIDDDESDWLRIPTEMKSETSKNVGNDFVNDTGRKKIAYNSSKGLEGSDYFKIPFDPDNAVMPLLRVNNADQCVALNNNCFRKCFRKTYTIIPTVRINMIDLTDDMDSMTMMESVKNPKKCKNISTAAGPSSFTSPKTALFSKKIFRI